MGGRRILLICQVAADVLLMTKVNTAVGDAIMSDHSLVSSTWASTGLCNAVATVVWTERVQNMPVP